MPINGRRILGLVAAYAIALQAILAVGQALPGAGHQSWLELCVGQSDGSSPAAPAHQADQQCCVAVCGHGPCGITPSRVQTALVRYAGAVHPAVRSAGGLQTVLAARPSWPRAPPV